MVFLQLGDKGHDKNIPPEFHQILERARRGEAEGLSALYRHFLPGVFGYIAARIPERVNAEDLTSDVFLQMVEGIAHVRSHEEAQFAAWLFQIARIAVAGYYRKAKKQPATVSLEPLAQSETLKREIESASLTEQAEIREEWGQVVQAINQLTEEQRMVLIGRLIHGYDIAEVAKMIGKKPNAVKALQFRALNSLHRLLAQQSAGETPHRERPRRGHHEITA
jgi:RNA polymerase sigma-70 factor (ECF subfamily)